MQHYERVSGVIFAIVSIAQLIRAVLGWPVQVASFTVPIWFSVVACMITAALALWGFGSSKGMA